MNSYFYKYGNKIFPSFFVWVLSKSELISGCYMSNIVIKVENLGKKYLIKHEQKEHYQTFQDMIINGSKNLVTSLNLFHKKDYKNDRSIEEFWALDDITMKINKGELLIEMGHRKINRSDPMIPMILKEFK